MIDLCSNAIGQWLTVTMTVTDYTQNYCTV